MKAPLTQNTEILSGIVIRNTKYCDFDILKGNLYKEQDHPKISYCLNYLSKHIFSCEYIYTLLNNYFKEPT